MPFQVRSSGSTPGKLVSKNIFPELTLYFELRKLANWFPKWEEYANLKR
jgi:hypothetical protein